MASINFKIVTPERIVYEDEVDSVTLPTIMGEITILPHHIPLVSTVASGELVVRKGNEAHPMAISGGFVEVREGSSVTVLADTAERVHEIDEARAEEAKERARKVLAERQAEDIDYTALATKIEKELARLRVARKYAHQRKIGPQIAKEE
ncbi:MAG: ATP synthase F1 subunit epsilon [Patescibacteria group bacterium]